MRTLVRSQWKQNSHSPCEKGEPALKKNSTENRPAEQRQLGREHHLERQQTLAGGLTIGLDVGDRGSCYCVLNAQGEVIGRGDVATGKQPLQVLFGKFPASLVAMEVGTHSPWISRVVEGMGHEVIVANARQVQLISKSSRKNDRLDAEMLARLARADRKLLAPVHHRSEEAQADLIGVRVRAQLVELRTQAINAVRGLVKSFGERLPACDADSLRRKQAEQLPEAIRGSIEDLLEVVEQLTGKIAESDRKLEKLSRERYGNETRRLEQVTGVGTITALSFVLTLDDPRRFAHSRDVGCYLGLRPKSRQSGDREPEMRISKEGDVYLRKLLVQCAQYILSRRGPDTDLKRWGQKIADKGKKKAKRRAVVAVARKLAILLHRMWVSGERYEPRRHSQAKAAA